MGKAGDRMTPRQAYAYSRPISDPREVVADRGLWRERTTPRGLIVRTCLAVDR